MSRANNRLLLEFERRVREVNHEVLGPLLPDVDLDALEPILRTVAEARADYVRALLARTAPGGTPTTDAEIEELRRLRTAYEELLAGAQAIEHAIERGYLDVALGRPRVAAAG